LQKYKDRDLTSTNMAMKLNIVVWPVEKVWAVTWEWKVGWVEAAGGICLWGKVEPDFIYPFFK